MSPLNRGPLVSGRPPSTSVCLLPPPRFGGRLVPHGMPPRMPLPMNPVFAGGPGPMRQRLPLPPRPTGVSRPNGLLPIFPGPRARGMLPAPLMAPQGAGLRNPGRHWYRRIPPPLPPLQMLPPMRPRFATMSNGNIKVKTTNNTKKVNKFEVCIYIHSHVRARLIFYWLVKSCFLCPWIIYNNTCTNSSLANLKRLTLIFADYFHIFKKIYMFSIRSVKKRSVWSGIFF